MAAVLAGYRKALVSNGWALCFLHKQAEEKPHPLYRSYNSSTESVFIPDGAFAGQTTQTVESSITNESEC